MSEFWKKELHKAKSSFGNLKPGAKIGIFAGATCLAIAGASGGNQESNVNVDAIAPIVVSEEEINDALDRCTLLKASDIYQTDSKISETELFQKAEKTCEEKKTEYEGQIDNYVKEVNNDWDENNSNLIAGKPLTYYLQEATNNTEGRVVAFAKPLQVINKQKAEAEAKKKAEEEAKKKAEEEAKQKAEAEAEAKRQAEASSNSSNNSTTTHQNQNTGITGYCKDGTPATGNPSAKGKANSCYGHGGWVR